MHRTNGILVTALAFGLSACGSTARLHKKGSDTGRNPAGGYPSPALSESPEQQLRHHLGKGARLITREEFPGVHAELAKGDVSAAAAALGRPRKVVYGSMGQPDKQYFLAPLPDWPRGDMGVVDEALLYYAIRRGDLRKARELVRAGAPPNDGPNYARPLLHMALDKTSETPSRSQLVRLLVESGADPKRVDDAGRGPLHLVLGSDAADGDELLELLIARGAETNRADASGCTPLHAALAPVRQDRQKTLALLLAHGADPNRADASGRTPLHAVFESESPDKQRTLTLLLAHGADPDAVDASGQTLLHRALALAAKGGPNLDQETVVDWLELIITDKTDLNARNGAGKTPLGLAFLGNLDQLREYLLSKGATDYGFRNASYDLSSASGIGVLGLGSTEIHGLDARQCHFILREYGVKFEPVVGVKSVGLPVRLLSDVNGIRYRHVADDRTFSVLDCRMAVALAGWSPILRKHRVKEVVHMRAYAPGARVGGRGRLSAHHFGLALDVAELVFDDGGRLSVKTDWKDHRGIDPCGGEFPQAEEIERRLRELTCETARFDVFSVILTPHYNRAHHDHLHVELDRTQYQFVR